MSTLSPAGWLYGRIADLRNSLYDHGVFKSLSLGAPTISIGNITAGGTGKTPLVAHSAEILAEDGARVAILTRGYGRKNPRSRVLVSDLENVLTDARTGGDEPVELATKLLGKAIVVADADRVAAAEWARTRFGITTFVLDDAFQHRRARRDLDIVCIDATNPFGNNEILPVGTLREPLANLGRADAIVITRSNLITDLSPLRLEISKLAPETPIFESSTKIRRLAEISAFSSATQIGEIRHQKALAFCAIGNPSNFYKQLSSEGFEIVSKKPFPDHHYYSKEQISKLEGRARNAGASILLTTAKDAVKLIDVEFGMPCYLVETELSVADENQFKSLILSFS